jgi:N-hydroxyarylamine O-acetyltransferase
MLLSQLFRPPPDLTATATSIARAGGLQLGIMEEMRLDDYLRRIGVPPPLDPTIETLRRLHQAHRETFLFENLSIQKGGGISLALDDLERKFLDQGCGGYCFEHNTLFGAALRELGFPFTLLLARVRRGPPSRWKRTHMVLRVVLDDGPWLADVGFGGFGLIEPMPLVVGSVSEQGGATYGLRREHGTWVLSMRDRSTIFDLFEFTEDPQTPGDIEVANHYTSTHPDSMFRRTLTIQRTSVSERIVLRTDTIVRFRDGTSIEEPLDPARLRAAVHEIFGIDLPDTPLVCERESLEVRT